MSGEQLCFVEICLTYFTFSFFLSNVKYGSLDWSCSFPGFGTAIGALSYGLCYKIHNSHTENPASGATTDNEEDLYSPKQRVGYGMLAAFLQLLFAPLIFGWIWSIR